jgi:hypothetical protein
MQLRYTSGAMHPCLFLSAPDGNGHFDYAGRARIKGDECTPRPGPMEAWPEDLVIQRQEYIPDGKDRAKKLVDPGSMVEVVPGACFG